MITLLVFHFGPEGQLPWKTFAVNTCVDCLDAGHVSVQAASGWWNNPGWVQQLSCTQYGAPPGEHSTGNSVGSVSVGPACRVTRGK